MEDAGCPVMVCDFNTINLFVDADAMLLVTLEQDNNSSQNKKLNLLDLRQNVYDSLILSVSRCMGLRIRRL